MSSLLIFFKSCKRSADPQNSSKGFRQLRISYSNILQPLRALLRLKIGKEVRVG